MWLKTFHKIIFLLRNTRWLDTYNLWHKPWRTVKKLGFPKGKIHTRNPYSRWFPPGLLIQGASPQVFCLKQMILSHLKLNCSAEPGSVELLAESHWISRYFKSNKRTQESSERGMQRFKTCRKVQLIISTENKVLGTLSKRRCNIVFKDFDEIKEQPISYGNILWYKGKISEATN